jgi:hypothetical protein
LEIPNLTLSKASTWAVENPATAACAMTGAAGLVLVAAPGAGAAAGAGLSTLGFGANGVAASECSTYKPTLFHTHPFTTMPLKQYNRLSGFRTTWLHWKCGGCERVCDSAKCRCRRCWSRGGQWRHAGLRGNHGLWECHYWGTVEPEGEAVTCAILENAIIQSKAKWRES